MALIKCPECGGNVSEQVNTCIHCGYPLHTNSNKKSTYKIFLTNCNNKKLYASTILYCDLGYTQEEAESLIKNIPIMIACNLNKSQAVTIANIFINKGLVISILDDAGNFIDLDDFINDNSVITDTNIDESQRNKDVIIEHSNKPKCPICGSENIEKISLTTKVISGATFGMFSNNIRNTFYCKKCGMKF